MSYTPDCTGGLRSSNRALTVYRPGLFVDLEPRPQRWPRSMTAICAAQPLSPAIHSPVLAVKCSGLNRPRAPRDVGMSARRRTRITRPRRCPGRSQSDHRVDGVAAAATFGRLRTDRSRGTWHPAHDGDPRRVVGPRLETTPPVRWDRPEPGTALWRVGIGRVAIDATTLGTGRSSTGRLPPPPDPAIRSAVIPNFSSPHHPQTDEAGSRSQDRSRWRKLPSLGQPQALTATMAR